MKAKTETLDKIKKYVQWLTTKFGRQPKYFKVDHGTEFINKEVEKYFSTLGIELQTTAPYSLAQNGIAERENRTLVELARAMIIAQKLLVFLWQEAVAHAEYLRNHAATWALDGKTPYEAWNRSKPNVSHF